MDLTDLVQLLNYNSLKKLLERISLKNKNLFSYLEILMLTSGFELATCDL